MKDTRYDVTRRDVLKTGSTGFLLVGSGVAVSGTATAAATQSTSFEFSDDCHDVRVTNNDYGGRYTLEVLLANGNVVTRSKQAPAGKSRRFHFARTIVKARVKVDGTVLGSAICPTTDFEFSDDCHKVTVTNTGYSGRYTLEVQFTNGRTTTRSKQASTGDSRTFTFSRTIAKVRVKIQGVVVGSAKCEVEEEAKADFEFSDDCHKVTVTNSGYSGRYTLEVAFTNGRTTTRSKNAPAGESRTFTFSRTIAKVRVKADGDIIGSARCDVEDDDDGEDAKAEFEFSDDCHDVRVTNTGYSGRYTLQILLANGNVVTRSKSARAGKSRRFHFARTIVKARVVDEDGDVLGSAICPTTDFEFSDDCRKVTVTNSGYSGRYTLEVAFTNGRTTTRSKQAPEGQSRTFSFSRTIAKVRVKIQGVVVGSAKCEVEEEAKADFEFGDDCHKVTVTNTGYSGRYTLEVQFTNGRTTTRSKQAPEGQSRTFTFSRTIAKVRVKADGDVIGSARCEDHDRDRDDDHDRDHDHDGDHDHDHDRDHDHDHDRDRDDDHDRDHDHDHDRDRDDDHDHDGDHDHDHDHDHDRDRDDDHDRDHDHDHDRDHDRDRDHDHDDHHH